MKKVLGEKEVLKILTLKKEGLENTVIAQRFGVTPSAVVWAVKNYNSKREEHDDEKDIQRGIRSAFEDSECSIEKHVCTSSLHSSPSGAMVYRKRTILR